jgi:D-galactarolactone cycloisomerase
MPPMSATIEKLEWWMLRAPIANPVVNAFGAMTTRPALFVRLSASDGAQGWGEVWGNFPQVGAEHRARLIESLFVPIVHGAECADPVAFAAMLEKRTHVMALQCDEPGPFAQVIAGLDQAAWDMAAKRASKPLWKYLSGKGGTVKVYASGIGPERVVETVVAKRAQGYRAWKLKVGMNRAGDKANLAAMREAVGPEGTIMVDANQGWTPAEARERIAELMPYKPHWVEEPMACDVPHAEWARLGRDTGAPLAAGENLRGTHQFVEAIGAGYLGFIQPDVGKWGGVTGCIDVARRAAAKGITFCPHWLAGGIGLAASMHLLAAAGGEGYAEVDANDNPLREEVFPLEIQDGWATLPDKPGLGVEPNLARLEKYRVS